jgi:hypothetical protein
MLVPVAVVGIVVINRLMETSTTYRHLQAQVGSDESPLWVIMAWMIVGFACFALVVAAFG